MHISDELPPSCVLRSNGGPRIDPKGEVVLVSRTNYSKLAHLKARRMQAGAVGIFVSELVHHFTLPPCVQGAKGEGGGEQHTYVKVHWDKGFEVVAECGACRENERILAAVLCFADITLDTFTHIFSCCATCAASSRSKTKGQSGTIWARRKQATLDE